MSEEAICRRLEITAEERATTYGIRPPAQSRWDDPAQLVTLGTLPATDIAALTDGLFAMDVPVEINRAVFDYDRVMIVGPVFPHEVVGFIGRQQVPVPRHRRAQILNFFHWLGAVLTNPRIIGNKWTAVRRVVDRAGSMVPIPRSAFCMVVDGKAGLLGLYAGDVEAAWSRAADLSDQVHVL
jgi:nickel-dependent lactate racemase